MQKIKYPDRHKFQTEDEYKEACHQTFEEAFKRFKRESKLVVQEAKRRQYYEAQSELKRRQKKRQARRERANRRREERELENSIY